MTVWSLFLQGVALGIAAAATPGAFQAYLITQSIIGGFKKGGIVAFSPLISDPPVVIIVVLFLNQLPESFLKTVSLAGGIFVIYLAYNIFRRWRKSSTVIVEESQTSRGYIFRGAILNILSPGLYLYWTLVNGPLLISAIHKSYLHGLSFLMGFYVFFVGGMLIISVIFAQAQRLGEKYLNNILLISTIILATFGIYLFLRSFYI